MPRVALSALMLAFAIAPSVAIALDSVRTAKATMTGTIEEITPQEVTLARASGRPLKIAVNQIISIRFDGEPPQLNSARSQILGGQFAAGLATLAKVEADMAGSNYSAIQQEIEYYKAYAGAQQALASGGDIQSAGRRLRSWVEANKNSYHWYEANELLGGLLVALGVYERAVTYYDRMEQAPWTDMKMRARIAKGRALLAQGKADEARQAFQAAEQMAADSDDPLVVRQKQDSQLGAAACLAETGDYDQAVENVEKVIVGTDPEAQTLNARAYNTLGRCLRKAGRPKEALMAFLHVDVLYFTDPREHALALKNLAQLWIEVGQPQRALEAERILEDRYSKK